MASFEASLVMNISTLKNGSNSSAQTEHYADWEGGERVPLVSRLIFGFLGLLGLLITAANSLVFVLVWKRPSLRIKTNYILVSLAASDFMSGTLAIPLLISCTSAPFYSNFLCYGMDIAQRFLAISTILHLTTAVLERFFKIADPFRHSSVVTKSKIVLAILFVWTISLLTAIIQTTWAEHPNSLQIYFIYDVVVLIVLVFLPFSFVAAAYMKMFLIIKRGNSKRKKLSAGQLKGQTKVSTKPKFKQNERRAMTVYFAMAVCFAVGWFPYFVLTILEDMEYFIEVPFWLSILLLFVKYGTSLVDPLLFTFFKADFQKALRSFFCKPAEEDTRLYSYINSGTITRKWSVDTSLTNRVNGNLKTMTVKLRGSSFLLDKTTVL